MRRVAHRLLRPARRDPTRVRINGERLRAADDAATDPKVIAPHRNATVTTCHSRIADLARHTGAAGILVVAIGRSGMVMADYVTANSIAIDVGTNVDAAGNLVSDVDPRVADTAKALSPCPAGSGRSRPHCRWSTRSPRPDAR